MYIDLKLRRQSKVFVCAYIIAMAFKMPLAANFVEKKDLRIENWKKELRIDLMVLLHGI